MGKERLYHGRRYQMRIAPVLPVYKSVNQLRKKQMTQQEMKAIRSSLKLTQKQLAEKLHLTEGQVVKLENGNSGISGGTLAALEMMQKSIQALR